MSEYVGYKSPPVHGQIKPGEVRNPEGGRAHYQGRVNSNIKKLTGAEVEEIGYLILTNNRDALKVIAKDETASVLKVWVATCVARAIGRGDAHVLDLLLNRFVGKIPEKH